jgi:uncharacterized RDD family membrane protein YckC
MVDETPPPTPSTSGFFSKPPQRPGASPAPARPARPTPPPDPVAFEAAGATGATEALGSSEPHPWTRYFARLIDIVIGGFALGVVLGLAGPALLEAMPSIVLGIFALFLWCFIEAVLLSTWGTTPGKALLGVTLRTAQGGKLDFGTALSRAFKVWVFGLGLGIPIVSLITVVKAYNRLKKLGETSWDAEGRFQVIHR